MDTKTENEILNLYVTQGKSSKTIGEILNLNQKTVLKVLNKHSVVRKAHYKYHCNDSYFETINTEEKAYWLGVLYADGNVSLNNCGTGQIFLSSIDKEWVQSFLKSISSTGILYKEEHKKYKKVIWKVHITSHKMFQDLCNLGCVPVKSKIIRFPKIDSKYISHFIRGYFDGDGTIGCYKNNSKYATKILRSGLCSGSELFLNELIRFLPTKNKTIHKLGRVFIIQWSTNDSIELCNYMYKDANIYLRRKKEKIQEFFKERRSTTIITQLTALEKLERKLKV